MTKTNGYFKCYARIQQLGPGTSDMCTQNNCQKLTSNSYQRTQIEDRKKDTLDLILCVKLHSLGE